jgi:hypothetical protein
VVFDGVVQQRGRDHVRIADAVVGHDPDGDPQRVVDVRLVLPPVLPMQLRSESQRVGQAAPVRLRHRRYFGCEPFPQALFAVGRGDRVQRHGLEQPLPTVARAWRGTPS